MIDTVPKIKAQQRSEMHALGFWAEVDGSAHGAGRSSLLH
jgi:hypothetical protein